MRYRGGRLTTPAAVLNHHGHDNFWIPIRRKTDEPGVFFEFFFRLSGVPAANDLSCSSFSAHIETLDLSALASSPFVDDTPHPLHDDIDCGFLNPVLFLDNPIDRQSQFLQYRRVDEVRLLQTPSSRQSTHSPSRLNWRDGDVPLADCHRYGIATIPFRF